ncbi:type VI secretion system protein TssA [Citrobacter sp. DNRA3]|uniref:type VI secretion system protein TssA n=1 Tax=Citrobacter sp. DNRA3 TaxID=2723054 RepID=UPI0014597E09|nr:type VI secretion system protein TssA [Citrobacter sp. DNRA3]NBJ29481.1 type VI secretion system protein TssA [Citrobacter freundii]NMD76371.1 type VI secretion system protein TssA [Citrobacter sp. DNRA3]
MSALKRLLAASTASPDEQQQLMEQAQTQTTLWKNWLLPISAANPGGEDPGYDDDFQRMREEVNKLSGAQTDLIIELAEKLLITTCKDVRVVTYYTWARLYQDGEPGLADGLILLAGLMQQYGDSLHPLRANSHKAALEWLAGGRMLDSLARFPEVSRPDAQRIAGALMLLEQQFSQREESIRPGLGALYSALENRLAQSGGAQALVPQNISTQASRHSAETPVLKSIASGRELLEQARVLAKYLSDQPDGWLAAHHLMKSVRLDTVSQLPPPDGAGRTRLVPPKSDYRAQLKRLYLQQSWTELIELTDSLFVEGVNHFWLDVQWYLHQALTRAGSPWDKNAGIIISDLKMLLHRMPGLETLAFNDGTPFADDVTREWIARDVLQESDWQMEKIAAASAGADDDILLLESEALTLADSEGVEAALAWVQARPGIVSRRQRWLRQLLMARLTEQCGRNDLALHLLGELNTTAHSLTLKQWEPELLFEVKARRLKLLRLKANRSESDKARLAPEMDSLLSGLVAIDPARAAVLCG